MEAAGTASPAAAPHFEKRRLRDRIGDFLLYAVTLAAAAGTVVLLGLIAWKIITGAHLAFSTFGLGFLTDSTWNPVSLPGHPEAYGALPLIFGTAVTSLIALLIATPLAIAIGLYLSELAPRGVRGAVSTLVELLAAIPSVVLGFWGILVFCPFLATHLEPWLKSTFGFLPIFSGEIPASGAGLLAAGLILSIMVLPIIASISRELFLAVPDEMQEGAFALGATRWEMIRGVILPAARSGIAAAVILGLGRALGEAIAVTQVIGNQTGPEGIHRSLFGPGDTLASRIANVFQGATTHLQTSTLFYLAVILLVMGLASNLLAQWIVGRFELKAAGLMAAAPETISLRPSGQLRRRRIVNWIMEALGTIAALFAVAVLGIVVFAVFKNGVQALSWAFFTQTPVTFGQTGGGIAHAIVGSAVLIALATLMALPVGVLVALYVTEFGRGRPAQVIRTTLDVMNGLPSIVIGVFIYGVLVVGHLQSGIAGGVALAIIMLPLVARSTQEVLLLVPGSLREAGLALGAPRWRTVLGVILPTALGGILTGTVLAIARVAGETAPLLFTTSIFANTVTWDPTQALPNIPVLIFQLSESPDPADHQKAWAASLILMTFVLVASVAGRLALNRSRKKLGR